GRTKMRDPTGAPISRRTFLGVSAAMLSAAALEACSSGAPATESKPAAPAAKPTEAAKPAAPAAAAQATTAPAAAAPAGGVKNIKTLVDQSWAELGMRDATVAYNEAMKGKVQVELEDGAAGWEPKAIAMIKA